MNALSIPTGNSFPENEHVLEDDTRNPMNETMEEKGPDSDVTVIGAVQGAVMSTTEDCLRRLQITPEQAGFRSLPELQSYLLRAVGSELSRGHRPENDSFVLDLNGLVSTITSLVRKLMAQMGTIQGLMQSMNLNLRETLALNDQNVTGPVHSLDIAQAVRSFWTADSIPDDQSAVRKAALRVIDGLERTHRLG